MYAAIVPTQGSANRAAALRDKRLNKIPNNWVWGMGVDLLMGAGPWIVGMVAICAGLMAIYSEIDGASETFKLFNTPATINAISTFAAFLLTTRQNANLANNSNIIGEFGNMSGALVNICLFIKAQISSGKSIEFITLQDGSVGGSFQTTRIALACSSVMYLSVFRTLVPL